MQSGLTIASGVEVVERPADVHYGILGDLQGQLPAGVLTTAWTTDSLGTVLCDIDRTISTGHVTSDAASHYDAPGSTPSWVSFTNGEWTRNIGGISGLLSAEQHDTETPTLQLANLHGDIVATVQDLESAKPSSAIEPTEYGVPTIKEPAKHSWLGA